MSGHLETTKLVPISIHDLARIFKKSPRWAAKRMREMPHRKIGGELFTSEEWFTKWMAAGVDVPQVGNRDPLQDDAKRIAITMIGELVKMGKVRVEGL